MNAADPSGLCRDPDTNRERPGHPGDLICAFSMPPGPPGIAGSSSRVTPGGPDEPPGQTGPSKGGGPGEIDGEIKGKFCRLVPSGSVTGASGGLGGIGSAGGGVDVVKNYDTGQVSAFVFGGFQVGWNGGVSGSIYRGFVWGLNGSNSNYSGGFSGLNGGAGLGSFAESSSGGLTSGTGGLLPNGEVNSAGISFGGGILGGFSGGATATNYTAPRQLGKFTGFSRLDWLLYTVRQVCK